MPDAARDESGRMPPPPVGREPVFNLPPVIVAIVAVLCAIHAGRMFLGPRDDLWVIYAFGFVPLRYDVTAVLNFTFPLSPVGAWVAPVTYALLHGGFVHLAINGLWLVAFGAPLARRFGTARFLLFSAGAAVAGAALHLVANWSSDTPMIGASAAVSGYMAAAMRFCFERGGPMSGFGRLAPEAAARVPRASLVDVWRNPRALAFTFIFLAVNLAVALMSGSETGGQVAWQAHIGGFVFGLVLFGAFDPVPPARRGGPPVVTARF